MKLRDKECSARAVTIFNVQGGVTVVKGPRQSKHEHAPNRAKCEAERLKATIQTRAENHPEIAPSVVIRGTIFDFCFFLALHDLFSIDARAGTSGGALTQISSRENLKKSIRRARRKNAPPNPKTLSELEEIPQLYQKTITGEDFLLYDSEERDELPDGRVLVFATRRNLEVLGECFKWSVDGTFKVNTLFTRTLQHLTIS